MFSEELLENRIKELRGEEAVTKDDHTFRKRTLLLDETNQIQARVNEMLNNYPDEFSDPDVIFSALGML